MKILIIFLLLIISLPSFARVRPPIVFVHGLGVRAEVYEYLVPLKRFFKERGYSLYIAKTPSGKSLEERAEVLDLEVKRLVPQGKFHLLAHSMGGLDSRLLIHKYGHGDRVVSLTTLATPHHGSAVADYAVKHLGDTVVEEILQKFFAGDVKAVRQLTTQYVTRVFNEEVQDDERVRYFSMGFYIPRPVQRYSLIPWLWAAHAIQVSSGVHYSDGMVGMESAHWGTSLGNFPGDHYSETGPIPLGGKMLYDDVFQIVVDNLELLAD